jgi:ubiquinone/menaquinone biosynthesis C-methylase UbiE
MPDAAYDPIAAWYDQLVRDGAVWPTVQQLLELAGDVAGQRICDVACGQGHLARVLRQRGAVVVGVDRSRRLLHLARGHEQPGQREVAYVQDDAQTLAALVDETFAGAFCVMALMDIPDLAATLRTARRVLRPGGWYVFAITHPCFQTPVSTWDTNADGTPCRRVAGYFQEGFWRADNPHGVRGRIGAYHRTLSTYVNALGAAGLALERLSEPRPSGALAKRLPPGYREAPAILLGRYRKV